MQKSETLYCDRLPMIMKTSITRLLLILLACTALAGCREDEVVMPAENETVPDIADPDTQIQGMYVLNEGNMGSNKCTIDYYDFPTGIYTRNFYGERNPDVIKELGDVGNDIAIYGSRLYAVINCSHKVEVMDARSGRRIGQVDIPNCRYISFHKGNAYVSSYVGPVLVDPDSPKGAVYRVDTLSLVVTGRVSVGYQPEEMAVSGNKMYVANSGGYRAPLYDNTISVINLEEFKQVRQISAAINMHRMRRDEQGKLWVTSRGNRQTQPSQLLVLSSEHENGEMELTDMLQVPCSNIAIHGDRLYYISSELNDYTGTNSISYGIIATRTKKVIATNFITDGTEHEIKMPYGLAVHPETGDIYLTDAKNYVSSGTLYCFSPEGKKKWSIRTGDIPASICFLPKSTSGN